MALRNTWSLIKPHCPLAYTKRSTIKPLRKSICNKNKVSMWKQINYREVYTQKMSKQCQAMINFSLKNSTVILPIQNLQSCWEAGMLPVAQLLFTNPGNPSLTLYTFRSPEMPPGFHLSSLYSLSVSFAEIENSEGEQNLPPQNMSLCHKDYFGLFLI